MSNVKKIYFSAMRSILSAVTKTIGPVHAPFTKKALHYEDVMTALNCVQTGDFILTRTNGELTTSVIPGFWKHVEMYSEAAHCIGAVSPCVRETWLANVIMRTDHVAILRLKDITPAEQSILLDYARRQRGKPYDFSLNIYDESEEFCSEIAYHAVNLARGDGYLQLWERMGYPAFTPNDLWGCAFKKTGALFDVVYINSSDEEIIMQYATAL